MVYTVILWVPLVNKIVINISELHVCILIKARLHVHPLPTPHEMITATVFSFFFLPKLVRPVKSKTKEFPFNIPRH